MNAAQTDLDSLNFSQLKLGQKRDLLHTHGVAILDRVPKTDSKDYLQWADALLMLDGDDAYRLSCIGKALGLVTPYLSSTKNAGVQAHAVATYAEALGSWEGERLVTGCDVPMRGIDFISSVSATRPPLRTPFFHGAAKIFLMTLLQRFKQDGAVDQNLLTHAVFTARRAVIGNKHDHLTENERSRFSSSDWFNPEHDTRWRRHATICAVDKNISRAATIVQSAIDNRNERGFPCRPAWIGLALILDKANGHAPSDERSFQAQFAKNPLHAKELGSVMEGRVSNYYPVLEQLIITRNASEPAPPQAARKNKTPSIFTP